ARDRAAAARVLVRSARHCLRAAAETVGSRAAVMNLDVRLRTRLSPRFELDLAFAAPPGVTIVFGEAGSGKTTLLRCVAGMTWPGAGRIAIGDRVLFDAPARIALAPADRRVGFVFQHLALFPHLTAAQNIAYGLSRLPAAERRERTHAIA